jgi:hypothetical protein
MVPVQRSKDAIHRGGIKLLIYRYRARTPGAELAGAWQVPRALSKPALEAPARSTRLDLIQVLASDPALQIEGVIKAGLFPPKPLDFCAASINCCKASLTPQRHCAP